MDTANKGPARNNKATMGNHASSGTDKKTPNQTAVSTDETKTKNSNMDSQQQARARDQSGSKREPKDGPKSPRATDQAKAQKSEMTAADPKPQTQVATTIKPVPSSQSATNDQTNNESSTETNSASKDDIPPLPTAQTGDKPIIKQDSSIKNPINVEASTSDLNTDDTTRTNDPSGSSMIQHYQKPGKAPHNNYQQQQQQQHQHHSISQSNQQHPQQQSLHHQHSNSNQYHSHFQPQHLHHQGTDEQLSKTNLYIRGLNADTSDNDLFTLCNRFGPIVSTKAILDKSTNKCKGYGFVDFDNPASAEMAVTELQKQGVLVHMAKQQEADPTNLYLANLPPTMTESDLENLLRPYGQVVSTRILINQNRQPRGVGFARMETKEQCDSIISVLSGQVIKGSKEPLLVKFADGANKKRPHHFQHKPLGGSLFMGGSHMRRNNGNDTNHYHMMNSGAGSNRNFHGGSFSEHPRQNHNLTHHDNGIIKHQQMLTSMPGYHPHHQSSSHHSYMMMGPTSAVDPSMHYVNLANQMQNLQIGNHPVSGYMSPQQWPQVWPQGSSSAFSNNSNTSRDAILR